MVLQQEDGERDIEESERAYRTLGGLCGYYRAIFEDTEQNKHYAEPASRRRSSRSAVNLEAP